MNTKAAADLIKKHYDVPGAGHIGENFLTAASPAARRRAAGPGWPSC